MGWIQDLIAKIRARDKARFAEQQARIQADAEKRLAENAKAAAIRDGDALLRAAERKRIAELSARGGAPLQDMSEFDVQYDDAESVRAGAARFRTKSRGIITAEQRPQIDFEATAAARAINPNAQAVFYWPDVPPR